MPLMMPLMMIERANLAVTWTVRTLCSILLVLMVVFTVYTVIMRYVFSNPPFWGDTVSVFCNIWVTLLGYSLAVRDREDIALRGFYKLLSPRAGFLLDMFWNAMVFSFGLYLLWYGWAAAGNVPGMYWELGGLPKLYPMLVLPIAGFLIAMSASMVILEDAFILLGRRPARDLTSAAQEMI